MAVFVARLDVIERWVSHVLERDVELSQGGHTEQGIPMPCMVQYGARPALARGPPESQPLNSRPLKELTGDLCLGRTVLRLKLL